MNTLVNCPGCGFRGRFPDALASLRTIVCPQCKSAVAVDQLRRGGVAGEDASYPIWVDARPVDRTPVPATAAEPELYSGDFMKEEAGRFAQYVATRLAELHKKRAQLADAESRFELMTMEQKQEVHRARAGVTSDGARVKEREAALQARAADLVAREASLAAREVEVVAREARVARAESRATETDRRTADLRSAIDQLEARRAALADEREALNRRAEALDRAELAQHRRSAELDELDERLRLEQDEFEREREAARAG